MTYACSTDLRRGLAGLLDRVAHGETIVLLRHGRPVARLVPLEDPVAEPRPAAWRQPLSRVLVQGESIASTLRRDRDVEP